MYAISNQEPQEVCYYLEVKHAYQLRVLIHLSCRACRTSHTIIDS
jgi:hypothetical protein